MEAGQLTWSTVLQMHVFAARFSEFALARGIGHPALVDDPAQLRALALEFRAFLHQWRRERPAHGLARGGPLNARSVARTLRFLGNFYRMMNDYRADAATATGDDRWLALTDSHARLYRSDELSAERAIRQADERNYISDTDLTRMLQYVELLGLPRDQTMTITRDGQAAEVAGLGHPAMMRAWLIQALTGRRAAEILLMDFHPLHRHPRRRPGRRPRRRDGGPAALPADQDRRRAGDHPGRRRCRPDRPRTAGLGPAALGSWAGRVGALPVPQAPGNRKGTRAWVTSHYDGMLRKLSDTLGCATPADAR